ncbi:MULTISPECIES: WcaF family extracellular polysaccharide biosynthesis acetyltransferase [Providencia]|uniref:WcaF family extracellular polysaccharide biosynthesis acetyltransferase n=1 Tax=Providencia TaxID=586 RepID=UPI0015EBBA63|nr:MULTISPECIES: WcaF family extracellular polysaccharide biosynthesis acetyltransferase [unclassified Providencia]QLQ65040.1 colanic acid biosynthesis acetyltransferase WcaF [Providencia rettgeri]URR21243.1 WcaF family extracellular polysaccharide biosynthesis acetyltransferase [Providencia rettgeri]WOB99670.1 WcaF family extracellular polysaccharide biosynthesis acetyltransferase [Providencia sp. PROV046]
MIKLSEYNSSYKHGNIIKRLLWLFLSLIFFENSLPFPTKFKVIILKLFGSKISKNIVIKPNVKIKYPWNLEIGAYSWIGEYVWIDNLAHVKIGSNCCISQGAYLLTGNHDYKKSTFDLIIKNIEIKEGAWVGAKAIVCPGVTINKYAILSVGSVANADLTENYIYQGNPAILKKVRVLE